jgi:predicted aspartyl protease
MGTFSLTCALALAAVSALGAPDAQIPPAGSTPTVLPNDDVVHISTADSRMTVPVRIGAHGPFRFLIDTGSESTVVSSELATKLGLTMQTRRNVTGIAGSRVVDTTAIDDIQFGHRTYNGLVVPLLAAAAIEADGIVGTDGLQGERVLLDFRHATMALAKTDSRAGDDGYTIVVTARRRLGQLIITQARIDGIATDVVIDTGSDTTIGNRALQHALAKRRPTTPTVLHSVTGQDIMADVGVGQTLDIDGLSIGNFAIAYADAPVFAVLKLDRHPAVLLGMHELRAFRRVAIDFSRREVLFDTAS